MTLAPPSPGLNLERTNGRQGSLTSTLKYALYAQFFFFAVANVYDQKLSGSLAYAKWAALVVTNIIVLRNLRHSHRTRAFGPVSLLIACLSVDLLSSNDLFLSGSVLLSIVLTMVAAYGLTCTLEREQQRASLFDIQIDVGRLVIFSSFLMWVVGWNFGRGGSRFSGWVDNPNTLALIICPSIVVLMGKVVFSKEKVRLFDVATLLIGLFIVKITGSRASFIWLMVSAATLWFARRGFGWAGVCIVLLTLGLLGWADELVGAVYNLFGREDAFGLEQKAILSGREEMWPLGLQLVEEAPLFGHGLGMSSQLIEKWNWSFNISQGLHFHNSYLTIAVECGLIILLIFSFVFLLTARRGAKIVSIIRKYNEGNLSYICALSIVCGALVHAFFETWLLSAGNCNALIFWFCVFLLWRPRFVVMNTFENR